MTEAQIQAMQQENAALKAQLLEAKEQRDRAIRELEEFKSEMSYLGLISD